MKIKAKKPRIQPAFPAGAAARVPKMGKGQVVSSTADMVTIVFADSEKRTFLKSYVEPN